MNITQIKSAIVAAISPSKPGFTLDVLTLNTQFDKDDDTKVNPDFLSHWDDAHRVRISMPRDVMNKILADKAFAGLAIKKPVVVLAHDDVAEYTRITIITPQSIEASF